MRGHQVPALRRNGVVKFHCPERHFGFIYDEATGDQVFFHNGDVLGDVQFEPGQTVSYEKGESQGKPCARYVRPAE
jgi:cold shock CspA family protein